MSYAFYDELPSPVAVFDAGLTMVYFNQAFARFFNLPPRKLSGKVLGDLFAASGARPAASVQAVLADGGSVALADVPVAAGGETKTVALQIFLAVNSPRGNEAVVALQDVSAAAAIQVQHQEQVAEITRYSHVLELIVEERTNELRRTAASVHRSVIEALAQASELRLGPAAGAYQVFLAEAEELIQTVSRELAAPGPVDGPALYRALHTVKGGAHHYGLAFLQHFAEAAEETLSKLRSEARVATAAERRQLSDDVAELATGLAALTALAAPDSAKAKSMDPREIWEGFVLDLGAKAGLLASELGKEAHLFVHASHAITGRDLRLFSSVMTHFLRNAVDHGIERPEIRRARGKTSAGRLTLTLDCLNGQWFGRFADDGAGIDLAAVARRGAALGLTSGEPGRLGLAEILRVLTAPGFSTQAEVTAISGRGVGLDAVMTELKSHGGHLALERSDGRGTSLTFSWKKLEDSTVPLDGDDADLPVSSDAAA